MISRAAGQQYKSARAGRVYVAEAHRGICPRWPNQMAGPTDNK